MARTVVVFAVLTIVVVVAVGAAGFVVIRRIAVDRAIEQARQLSNVLRSTRGTASVRWGRDR